MTYIVIVIVLIIALLFYVEYGAQPEVNNSTGTVVPTVTVVSSQSESEPEDIEEFSSSWKDIAMGSSIDQSVVDSQRQYIANVTNYSSGANFTSVADDNTSPVFTNFVGFSRPRYVEIDPTARQVPDVDISVLKRNKYMTFSSDLEDEKRGKGRMYSAR